MKNVNLCLSQIITQNPIIYDSMDTRKEYLKRIKKYLRIGGWSRRKYESSELEAYEKIILSSKEIKKENNIEFYKYYILFDLIHILGYETSKLSPNKLKNVKQQYLSDFKESNSVSFSKIINSVQGEERRIVNLKKNELFRNEINYIELIRKNIAFRKKNPFTLMVTATMSAGKSTCINSLIGKNVCLSQNMACTSKIHSIINKAFEDGYSSEYDHDLVMTAGKEELFDNNKDNSSDMIYVATNFNGVLSNSRVVVNDSPGVNFSEDQEHRKITEKLIRRRKFDLLVYVMNATQLGTNDEDEHLDYVKRTIGRTPVIFVMNKVDYFNVEEENVKVIINRQIKYLKKKGFKNPVVCPVSARAGYLAKQFLSIGLSRSEERELYNYIDKFEQMKLVDYYKSHFPDIVIEDEAQEEKQLLKTCGLEYVEQIIKECIKGGK